MKSISSPVTNGNRVAPGSAAAPVTAALGRRLLFARCKPARGSFTRRCLSACGRGKNTRRPVRSGNGTAVVLAAAFAPAGAFVGASSGTAAASSGRGYTRGCRTVILTPGALSRLRAFARAHLPVPWQSASPNPPFQGTLRDKAPRSAPELAR